MKISAVADAANCSTETIRFYEKVGLLPAAKRTSGNYRDYNSDYLERLRLIRNCRALDMTHNEIRVLLERVDSAAGDCSAVNELLDEHIGHVDVRLAELRHLKRQLHDLRQQCQRNQPLDACGILHGLAAMELGPSDKHHTHL